MNRYLLVTKIDGQIYMTAHDSQHSMSREVILVQKENGIKLDILKISSLSWSCIMDDYPDNIAFAVQIGIDAAIIPMTDAQIKDHDREVVASWTQQKRDAVKKVLAASNIECPNLAVADALNDSYVSPFDGKQK